MAGMTIAAYPNLRAALIVPKRVSGLIEVCLVPHSGQGISGACIACPQVKHGVPLDRAIRVIDLDTRN